MSENFPPLPQLQQVMPTLRANPPGTRSSYLSVATNRAGARNSPSATLSYAKMLLDPLARENSVRYPDETIVPTALTHFTASKTLKSTAGVTSYVTVDWKVWNSTSGLYATDDISVIPPALGYSSPAAQWLGLTAIDRTLAFCVRARVVGLPTSTFLPSGTIYFLQLQVDENSPFAADLISVGESVAMQAVAAGKGFSMTVNELSRGSGVTIPYLPQGPMSYVFSNSGVNVATGSTNVSSNGYLTVVTFGCDSGLQIRYDFAHHIEYIPTRAAAGLIFTEICPPSIGVREGIASISAAVQNKIAGSTTASNVQNVLDPAVIASYGTGRMIGASASFLSPSPIVPLIRTGSSLASLAAPSLGAPAWLTSAMSGLGYGGI